MNLFSHCYLCKSTGKFTLTKRIVHIILSVWLSAIVLFGSTPKEFIHLFAHHTDTVHSVHEKDGLVIEQEHHHCTFLNYALPLFVNDIHAVPIAYYKQVYPQYHESYVADAPVVLIQHLFLRGPPLA